MGLFVLMSTFSVLLVSLSGVSAFAGAALRGCAPTMQPAAASIQMGVPVADFNGATVGEEDLSLKVAKSGAYLVHRKVVAEQANMRLGAACTKTRADVRGGGRKPYKQKGTGNARRGSTRSPLIVGGGVSFGPKPKSYKIKINKKEGRLALSTALMGAVPRMKMVQDFEGNFQTAKTADMKAFLNRLEVRRLMSTSRHARPLPYPHTSFLLPSPPPVLAPYNRTHPRATPAWPVHMLSSPPPPRPTAQLGRRMRRWTRKLARAL